MKNVTVSVDDDTYRLSRVRAAEFDTSVSAMVRGFLERLVREGADDSGEHRAGGETEAERRERLLDEVFEEICATRSGFKATDKATDNVGREELYERNAIR